jgi:ubiquinone/menaquinone biosynthesis C-methylase UbiE
MALAGFRIAALLQRAFRRVYRWATHRLYRELAWAYEVVAWLVSLGRWDGWRRQTLEYCTGSRVLEVGFGTGALLSAAARRGMKVWGADPARAMQRVAARRLRREGLSVPRVRSTAQALPFPSCSFDTVLSTFPADYIVDPQTLSEVARVLRKGGGDARAGRLVVTGLGFRTADPWLARLLRLVFGGGREDGVSWYAEFAAAHGFKVTVMEDEARRVRVPVLILEKEAEGSK